MMVLTNFFTQLIKVNQRPKTPYFPGCTTELRNEYSFEEENIVSAI